MRYTFAPLAILLLAPALAGESHILHLPIGDPDRRDHEVELRLDAITDARTGDLLAPDELAPRLKQVRLLFVGEQHTNMDSHRVQQRVIEALTSAGREVLIGLEMYPYTGQSYLDQWVAGQLTEQGFVELSRWYENWGYHWSYYRDIFLFARRKAIRMFGVNVPREVIRAVRKQGLENLSEEQAAHIPTQIDTDNEQHRRLFRAFFEEEPDGFHAELSVEQWDGMFSAQCTWDATMGFNAVKALTERGGPEAVMVVLIGSGHVAYGLGAQRQVAQWFDGRVATIIPLPVRDEDGEWISSVRASYADFVWGLPPWQSPQQPQLGISTTATADGERRMVIHVPAESVGGKAGFQVGDVLLAMNGTGIPDREALNRLTAELRWGDIAEFTVRRGEATLRLTAKFRREARKNPRPDDKPDDVAGGGSGSAQE